MHLSSALALLVGLVLVVSVTSESEPTIELTDPQGCEYNGVHYEPEQEFNDGACTLCWCPSYSTEAQCFDIQCNIPDCPNGTVTRPGDCCPSCVE